MHSFKVILEYKFELANSLHLSVKIKEIFSRGGNEKHKTKTQSECACILMK